jgi:tyrosyl-tRNA synthetase
MNISTDTKKIAELLTRGVEEVIDRENLEKKLKSGKQLRVKLGIDPTSPNLHLGRSIPLMKLRDFQELGHQIIFIVGDATGVIGDTSDKDSERPMLAREDVEKNLQSYKDQVGKILDLDKIEFRHNSEWLNELSYDEIGEHADVFSLAEFLSRDNIRRRLEAGTRVSLRELLYPLMQGYDSVAIKADVELGGTDQRFNLLAGRTLQSHFGQEPQDILMNPLVVGSDGRKMSSSWGNTVDLTDGPDDMFGKIMSIPDELIVLYFTYMTRVPMEDIESYTKAMKDGGNPRDYKVLLGKAIVSFYHSPEDGEKAEATFVNTFSNKQTPDEMQELSPESNNIIDVLVEAGFATSKGEARRAIDGGGVRINDEKIESHDVEVKKEDVVNKGKRHFIRII